MTMPQAVEVRQLTEANAHEFRVTGRGVNLGSTLLQSKLNSILDKIKKGAEIFLVDWEGSKIPRGVLVRGYEIAWTQNGAVTEVGGARIGTYQRLVEFGGETRQHHQMLIYIWKSLLTAGLA